MPHRWQLARIFLLCFGAQALVLLAACSAAAQPSQSKETSQTELLRHRITLLETQVLQERLQRLDAHLDDTDKSQKDQLEKQQIALLEMQRKSVDWWLTAIGLMLTVFGIVVALVGFWLPREHRARLKVDRAELDVMLKESRESIATMRKHEQTAADAVASAKVDANKTEELRKKAESYMLESSDTKSPQSNREAIESARQLEALPQATDTDRLRAKAILVGEQALAKSDHASAEKAYTLWAALVELNASDHSAHFNAGYWAHVLRDMASDIQRTHWFEKTERHYSEALRVRPNMHEAANNLGGALDNQARTDVKAGHPDTARNLWSQAAEKYALALKIKPDKHEAAYNWGSALGAQAQAEAAAGDAYNWGSALGAQAQAEAAAGELDTARALWSQAAEKYALALKIKSDDHDAANSWGATLLQHASAEAKAGEAEAVHRLLASSRKLFADQVAKYPKAATVLAYNWACVYGLQGKAAPCVAQLEIARKGKTLPSKTHLEEDSDLRPIRDSSEFVAWWQQHFGGDVPQASS